MAIGGSVSGNGTVWCEGLMMVPWTPCEPYCENESAYCSPGGVNQKFAVKTKLDNGPDIFVSMILSIRVKRTIVLYLLL